MPAVRRFRPFTVLIVTLVCLGACSGSSESGSTTGPSSPGGTGGSGGASGGIPCVLPTTDRACGVYGVVADNHEGALHVARITRDQLDAGEPIVIDIQGLGRHPHTLSLTSDQVKQIAAGQRVVRQSSTNPHSGGTGDHYHMVTFN